MNKLNPLYITQETIDRILRLGGAAMRDHDKEINLVEAIQELTDQERAELLILFMLNRACPPPILAEPTFRLDQLLFPFVQALNEAVPKSEIPLMILPEFYPPEDPYQLHLSMPPDHQDWRLSWLTNEFGPESGNLVTFRVHTSSPEFINGSTRSKLVVGCRKDASDSTLRAEIDRLIGLLDEKLVVGRAKRSTSAT